MNTTADKIFTAPTEKLTEDYSQGDSASGKAVRLSEELEAIKGG